MATLTVAEIGRAGVTPAFVAAAGGGDQFLNDGRTFVEFKNTSGGNITVTVVTQTTVLGNAVADDAIVIPLTSGNKRIGPFPPGVYNDANGYVQLTYSGVTNLTVEAVRLP